jgi:MYXO-CTERM domain-containing protein
MTRPWLVGSSALIGLLGACVDSSPTLGEAVSASTVGDYIGSGCSTAVVIGLSKQIADEAACVTPGAFVPFPSGNGITLTSSAVVPYLEQSARDDLLAVAAAHPLQINSALRTVASQYLLVQWFDEGRCGITAAAAPGRSNHEGGRAVDLSNYSSRISNMAARGWAHDVPGDPVHFDHTSSPDGRGQDVLAFQRLWNRNNATDQISEDGVYGPQTGARVKMAPATGFAIGPICQSQMVALASVESVDGPDRVGSGQRAHYTMTLRNNGTTDWPDTTQIAVASGQPSQLYDSQSWASPTTIGTLGTFVAVGDETVIQLDVQVPSVTADTPIDETLVLVDGSQQLGTMDIALTVAMDNVGSSADGQDTHDDAQSTTGGCSSGGASGIALVGLALVFRRRRR